MSFSFTRGIAIPTRLRAPGFLRRFASKRTGLIAAGFIVLLVLATVLLPLVWTVDPNAQDLRNTLAAPSAEHPLGTDAFGRDLLARLISGGQVSLQAAVQATLLALAIGVPLGLLAGYLKGVVDVVLSRIVDALIAMPSLVVIFAIVGIIGPGLTNAMIALGIVLSTEFFRVARGATMDVGSQLYVTAGRAVGLHPVRILGGYILPNAIGPILIQTSFAAAIAIVGEASLSFIGVGVQLPQASWGSLVRDGFTAIYQNAFVVVPPSILVIVTILSFSVLGDALRDSLGRRSFGSSR